MKRAHVGAFSLERRAAAFGTSCRREKGGLIDFSMKCISVAEESYEKSMNDNKVLRGDRTKATPDPGCQWCP